MTWKRRSKRSLRRLGKTDPHPSSPKFDITYIDESCGLFIVAFGGGAEGGMVWEGKPKYKSVDAALDDLEAALEKIIEEIG
jgi:hypothetical protein